MLWVKTAHILFVMAWMAGIFYLPRIFVHYAEARDLDQDCTRLDVMASRLVRFAAIMAILACVFGFWLWLGYGITGSWLMLKLVFVALLIAYHYQCFRYTRRINSGDVLRSSLYFRVFNESALLLLIPILILVVVKPFP